MKIDWDEELSQEMQNEWTNFKHELTHLNQLKINRFVFSNNAVVRTELHGFGDASEKAYGAALYVRSIDIQGNINIKLLCSKSKIAPVKLLTIPRLELCAAIMVVELVSKVKKALEITIDETYLWTDSQIVLSWIKGEPSSFKTYVAHRLVVIHEKSTINQWNYVATKNNPADIISRGMSASRLIDSELWFQGPKFLTLQEDQWPLRSLSIVRVVEEEKNTVLLINKMSSNEVKHLIELIDHRNSFMFLQRSMAYVLRAINKMKKIKSVPHSQSWLTSDELNNALSEIIKETQQIHFFEEIKQLKKDGQVNKNNRLASLSVFLDEKEIIRVGGRLENGSIGYNAKHPWLLPGNDFVSKLIFDHLHKQHYHAGPLALLAIARQPFWVIKGRLLARSTVSKCVACSKAKPQLLQQQMGNLPDKRVIPARPFLYSGVDFCGPFWIHYHLSVPILDTQQTTNKMLYRSILLFRYQSNPFGCSI
ncbi:uncharacterized protein LOC129619372 [Condylostylus longicornis]|uniref:uncharacterized protein LOC129619372 n=1 Tax=Condylostylus longicornis TaxID=2530218 RepID=UPI00244DFEA6|nr:uncharacterized protein LOC129619372 [Condylostylus longicornis]